MGSDMTAHEIGLTIMAEQKANFCLPRYTPVGWWECDVIEVTKAGYWREYEIKLTRQDFLNDAMKYKRTREWLGAGQGYRVAKKHTMLAERHKDGPNAFIFVTKKGIVTEADIPVWAGWAEVERRENSHLIPYRFSIIPRRPAPKLHTHKLEERVRKHMESVCYYRFHALALDYARLTAKQSPTKTPKPIKPVSTLLEPVKVPGLIDPLSAPRGEIPTNENKVPNRGSHRAA